MSRLFSIILFLTLPNIILASDTELNIDLPQNNYKPVARVIYDNQLKIQGFNKDINRSKDTFTFKEYDYEKSSNTKSKRLECLGFIV